LLVPTQYKKALTELRREVIVTTPVTFPGRSFSFGFSKAVCAFIDRPAQESKRVHKHVPEDELCRMKLTGSTWALRRKWWSEFWANNGIRHSSNRSHVLDEAEFKVKLAEKKNEAPDPEDLKWLSIQAASARKEDAPNPYDYEALV
jgi:hypothetical protein